jgi:hypothetical protein
MKYIFHTTVRRHALLLFKLHVQTRYICLPCLYTHPSHQCTYPRALSCSRSSDAFDIKTSINSLQSKAVGPVFLTARDSSVFTNNRLQPWCLVQNIEYQSSKDKFCSSYFNLWYLIKVQIRGRDGKYQRKCYLVFKRSTSVFLISNVRQNGMGIKL